MLDLRKFLRDYKSSSLFEASDNFCIKKSGIAKKAVSILSVTAEQNVQFVRSTSLHESKKVFGYIIRGLFSKLSTVASLLLPPLQVAWEARRRLMQGSLKSGSRPHSSFLMGRRTAGAGAVRVGDMKFEIY